MVIAASAVAALIQIRHLRGSNQIAVIVECRQILESAEFRASRRFLKTQLPLLMRDPAVLRQLQESPLSDELAPILGVGNFLENLGAYVKYGILDRRLACDIWGGVVLEAWDNLAPASAIMRTKHGDDLFENFEYLVVLSKEWQAAHPSGAYPKGTSRLTLPMPARLPDHGAGDAELLPRCADAHVDASSLLEP